ncbi:hypothetical protein [Neobacillus sp.]|uniref:hypothetical protein n=1 Tax=Neobacillus sp. TaxID=2675273 RepID=UPI0028976639|nr:hypothetical protein [Neobacillus sp.]
MDVPVPLTKEQIKIVKRVMSILLKLEKIEEFYSDLEKIKILSNLVLSKAFRGELGTNDPSEESAVELLKEVLQEKVK